MSLKSTLLGLLFRRRRWFVAAATLMLLYAILGFFIVPAVVKSQLPPRLGRLLGRRVSVEKVRANPFVLSLTLEGFRIDDRDGSAFLGWERLYVNAQLSSLFGRTLSFREISLYRPYGRVVAEKGGRLNFTDIIERLSPKEPKPAPEAGGKATELAIGHLEIREARIVLVDRGPAEPFTSTLGPLSVVLDEFRTQRDSNTPYAFQGRTESGESFAWKGTFSLDPLRSEGHLDLEGLLLPKYHPYYGDQVDFDLKGGRLTARGGYVFQWAEGVHVCRVSDASVELKDLALGPRGRSATPLSLPVLEARGIQADLLEASVDVASLTLKRGAVDLVRLESGAIDLVKLLTPHPRPPREDDGKPLRLRLREAALQDFRVAFEDRATLRPVRTVVEDLDLVVRDFDLDPAHKLALELSMALQGRGRIQARGQVAAFKPELDLELKVQDLDLPPFDPYLEPGLDLRVSRGRLNLEGRFRGIFQGGRGDRVSYAGQARLDGFEAMDGARREPFLRYGSLRLAGLELGTNPEVLTIRSVELVEPESRLVVAADGSTNVSRALKLAPPPADGGPGQPKPGAGVLASALPATPKAPEGRPFEVSIAQIRIRGGRLSFIDRSLEPNAALLLTDLQGSYTGLSTRPETASAVEFKGLAGGLAPVLIQGRAIPLRHDKDTDLAVSIRGAELSDLGPYSGKYLGYAIRKGKLDLDARVRIQDRKLLVEDKVRMDQFQLGEKTQSPDATHLPVKLALALLRDRNGVIEVELPVDGSLDDPDFHYGKIVWHAITNALVKLVASPFTLLGKLFGGGDRDLSSLAFAPGSAVLDAEAVNKVEVLARSLIERPDLSLEVEATTDPAADLAALKRQQLELLLRRTKANALAAGTPGLDPEGVTIDAGERGTWLRAAFQAAFPAPRPQPGREKEPPPPPPPPAEMEQRLLASMEVPPGELRQLADARAKAVVRLLIKDGRVEAARVFEVEGGERARKEGGSRAWFTLK